MVKNAYGQLLDLGRHWDMLKVIVSISVPEMEKVTSSQNYECCVVVFVCLPSAKRCCVTWPPEQLQPQQQWSDKETMCCANLWLLMVWGLQE